MDDLLKNHMFATHAVVAAGSVVVGSSLTHPLDSLKSLLQVASGSRQQLGLTQVTERIRAVSGLSGFYSGLGWTTLGRISGLGLRFISFELLSAFFRDGREDDYLFVSEALLAGIAAGATEAVVSTPFELFKLRRQLSSAAYVRKVDSPEALLSRSSFCSKLLRGYTPDMKSLRDIVATLSALPAKNVDMYNALREYPWLLTGSPRPPLASSIRSPLHVVSLEGWSSLWKGLRSGLARDCIFGGIFFSTWQFLHDAMLVWKAVDMNPVPRSIAEIGPLSPLAISVAAGISGSVAAVASHSFDTAKTRTQCIVLPKEWLLQGQKRYQITPIIYSHSTLYPNYISMERKFLRWKAQGPWLHRMTGISPADRGVLSRGLWLRMGRSGAASFLIVGSYLWAVDKLF